MKASDFLAKFPLAPGDPRERALFLRLVLRYIADNLYSFQREDGRPLRDAIDYKEFFERAVCLAYIPPEKSRPVPRDYTCPDCQHEHEGRDECKVYLGEGRFCPCEAKVRA